ncbi:hypothetical protein M3611_26655 [Priestia megaterium]|uniref:hypothetical protein n=1 Tax=Priestia megaterium TaxID=1404 RepID=UPI0020410E15|nr:hypothetical protein [Priestia megaterium]MCM3155576.1 hypothetical protein [Priestia megaterium]
MAKNVVQKAEKLVSGAVGVFADAILQVEKANELLKAGIETDNKKIDQIELDIRKLNAEKVELVEDKSNKYLQMESNKELIEKLSHFSK